MLLDPVRNRYFQIGWAAFQLLQRWGSDTAHQVLEKVTSETTYKATPTEVEQFIKFLYANNLTEQPPGGSSRDYLAQAEARHQKWWLWLIHHYLFFRIPLVRPHRFLQATYPFVAPFFTKAAGRLVALLAVTGLYLVSRQWEAFVSTFLHFFTFQGLIFYGIALCGVKVLHELGHAYTATQFGCRVPTMGVALLVLFPMLYSDTTEAWRLTARRQRAWIAAAGVIAELSLAAVATCLWSFLPDGRGRSIAFIVATTSLMLSLTINLNPFMRFDGYYLLSDWLGVPNLQDRAFALGRWKLRELLFAPGASPPETWPRSLHRILIAYAWATWLYRIVLFTGIALLVYHLFFKVLGVVLFAVEMLWFVILPIVAEIKAWWHARKVLASTHHAWITFAALGTLIVLVGVPWSTRITCSAVLQSTPYATVYAPAPGRIIASQVRQGQVVKQGDVLLTLEAPTIDRDLRRTVTEIEVLELRSRRQAANMQDRADNHVVTQMLRTRLAELEGLNQKRDNLVLKAPIAGVVTDRAESLHPGRWINEKLALAYLVDPSATEILAFAEAEDLLYLAVGQAARFIPDDFTRESIAARVVEIHEANEHDFMVPYGASLFGGEVPVQRDQQGHLKPERSMYRLRLELSTPRDSVTQASTGQLQVDGRPWSIAGAAWERVLAVLVRESGF